MIKRDLNKVPKMADNPASSLIEDTIEHFNLSQAATAKGLGVSRSLLNEVLKRKRGVSMDLAMRLEAFFGISSNLLIRLQADFDYQKAYHGNGAQIRSEVKRLEIA